MGHDILELSGAPAVSVRLRRSARARRMCLRVSRVDGRVTLTAPPHVPVRELRGFLHERADWVRTALAVQPPQVQVAEGTLLPVQGTGVRVVGAPVRQPQRHGETLRVSPARATQHAKAYVCGVAKELLTARCAAAARTVGRSYEQIVLRDTRARWGSCSSSGRLMFSWRLAMAPPRILDYVAAHEVAHLVEMNHAPAFWAVVARLHPDYVADRAWLRENGAWLHRYRFETAP